MVVDTAPFRDALMVALPLDVIAAVVAVKVAEVELAGTLTDAGTVRVVLLEDKATAVAVVRDALETVIVHEVLAFETKLVAAHCKEDRLTGA